MSWLDDIMQAFGIAGAQPPQQPQPPAAQNWMQAAQPQQPSLGTGGQVAQQNNQGLLNQILQSPLTQGIAGYLSSSLGAPHGTSGWGRTAAGTGGFFNAYNQAEATQAGRPLAAAQTAKAQAEAKAAQMGLQPIPQSVLDQYKPELDALDKAAATEKDPMTKAEYMNEAAEMRGLIQMASGPNPAISADTFVKQMDSRNMAKAYANIAAAGASSGKAEMDRMIAEYLAAHGMGAPPPYAFTPAGGGGGAGGGPTTVASPAGPGAPSTPAAPSAPSTVAAADPTTAAPDPTKAAPAPSPTVPPRGAASPTAAGGAWGFKPVGTTTTPTGIQLAADPNGDWWAIQAGAAPTKVGKLDNLPAPRNPSNIAQIQKTTEGPIAISFADAPDKYFWRPSGTGQWLPYPTTAASPAASSTPKEAISPKPTPMPVSSAAEPSGAPTP